MRFLSEIVSPEKKCARLGHQSRPVKKSILRLVGVPVDFRVYNAELDECRRCGRLSEPRNEIEVRFLQSVTMGGDTYDRLLEQGWVEWE